MRPNFLLNTVGQFHPAPRHEVLAISMALQLFAAAAKNLLAVVAQPTPKNEKYNGTVDGVTAQLPHERDWRNQKPKIWDALQKLGQSSQAAAKKLHYVTLGIEMPDLTIEHTVADGMTCGLTAIIVDVGKDYVSNGKDK